MAAGAAIVQHPSVGVHASLHVIGNRPWPQDS